MVIKMSSVLEKYSAQLRQVVDDYYHNQMTLSEYRAQRNIILDCIEIEIAGPSNDDTTKSGDSGG